MVTTKESIKILYLYLEDFGCLKECEFNFDSEHQFSFNREKHELTYTHHSEKTLENFFKTKDFCQKSIPPVSSISAVIGDNGGGKTTVAHAITRIINDRMESRYILIFEVDGEFYLKRTNDEFCETVIGIKLKTYSSKSFDFIYLSTHYVAQDGFNFFPEKFTNLSTKRLLRKDYEKYFNGFDKTKGNIDYELAHYFMEIRRLAEFLSEFVKKNKPQDMIPMPMFLYFRINDYDFKQLGDTLDQKILDKEEQLKNNPKDTNIESCKNVLEQIKRYYQDLQKIDTPEYRAKIPHDISDPISNLADLIKTVFGHVVYYSLNAIGGEFSINENFNETMTSLIEKLLNYKYKEAIEFLRENNEYIISFTRDGGHGEIFRTSTLNKLISELYPSKECGRIKEVAFADKDALVRIKNIIESLREMIPSSNPSSSIPFTSIIDFPLFPSPSAGELSQMSIYSRLYNHLMNSSNSHYVIFLDEVETTVHPQIQRKIIWNLIRFFEIFFPKKRFHLIFASHSPIILSDIPKSNVCFLERKGNEKKVIVNSDTIKKAENTFGANIHTLYRHSYFLENGTMGTFAEEKINEAIEIIKTAEMDVPNKLQKKEYEKCSKIISLIGEPIIKDHLFNRLLHVSNHEIDLEIERLKNRIKELEAKK